MSSLRARTWLFVPADRPDRFAKAVGSGADRVIVDLEDAVAPERRADAREALRVALRDNGDYVVRVNSPATPDGVRDLEALAESAERPRAIMVPKTESIDELRAAAVLGVPLVGLIETAAGLSRVSALASTSQVERLAFGAVDFTLDISSSADDDVLSYVRSRLVVESRAAGIGAPLDSPSLAINDEDAVARSAAVAVRFGMGGKLCVHPRQVAIVSKAFAPDVEQIDFARRVLAAGDGVGVVDGAMVDRPVLERARAVLEDAGILRNEAT